MGKSCPNFWTISVFFKKVPKVNKRTTCENSPNLVTLAATFGE
jgi:hypothetical protein